MKLRDPEEKPGSLVDPQKIKKTLKASATIVPSKWKQYKVRLITPMFGGGISAGKPDTKMPVRVTAIRGQLRYWWRFLAKCRKDKPLSGETLFKEERAIWGGMAEDGQDYNSKVKIRISNVKPNSIRRQQYNNKEAGYVLFPARKQTGRNATPAKHLIREGMTFDLLISTPSDLMSQRVEPALRWWATFGGLGARTRRGCGQIHVDGPEPVNQEEAGEFGCKFVFCGNFRSDTPVGAWKKAVQCLSDFRQKAGIGRNQGNDRTPSRSKWPEPDSIREITEAVFSYHTPENKARISFPRAAFGMPIIFKFKDDYRGDPQLTELSPQGYKRLASPLFLSSYPVSQGEQIKYRPLAMLIPHDHINGLDLQLSYSGDDENAALPACPQGKEDVWKKAGWINWQNDWQNPDKLKLVEPIKKLAEQDALNAFMAFFAKGGQING